MPFASSWRTGIPRPIWMPGNEASLAEHPCSIRTWVTRTPSCPDHAGEVYRGYDGLARATERWLEPFKTMTVDLERVVGTQDRLVSIHRLHAVTEHTDLKFDESVAYVWTFRGGKVVHLKAYWEPADALRAAGLED